MLSKSVPIGARARRFTLELPVEIPDAFGGVERSFVAGPQFWGAIELVGGGERRRGDRCEQAITHRVRLRFRAGITGAMRLADGPRRFAIHLAADPDGSRRELVCLVEEVAP